MGTAAQTTEGIAHKRPRVGLVLAGGGALGFAHVGVIRILEGMGIPVDIVVGTSMGATVGGFYSLGYSPDRMHEVILGIDWVDMFSEHGHSSEERFRTRIDRSKYFAYVEFDDRGLKLPGSVFSGRKMLYFLDRMTLSMPTPVDFDAMPRRFRAVAADLKTGERVVIGGGSLSDSMRASMGIPGIFSPYEVDGRYLVDGGIVDNLPVGTARAIGADLIIAVDLLGGTPFALEDYERNPVNVVARSMDIMLRSNVKPQLAEADLVLSVDLSGYGPTDFLKAAEIIARGESTARDAASEIEAFKAMLGKLAPGDGRIELPPGAAFRRVAVEGGSDKARALVAAAFSQAVGAIPDEGFLARAVAKLDSEGIYESIRIQRSGPESDLTLKVKLRKRDKPGRTFLLGIGYASTYSGSATSVAGISAGVVIRGLTSEDSRLAISMAMLDSMAFEASFIQPVLPRLFVEGRLMGLVENAIYASAAAVNYLYQAKSLDIGIDIGLHPTEWAEFSAGVGYEWVQHDPIPDFRAGGAIGSAPMGHALFSIRRLDSEVFPTKGVSVLLRLDQSLSGSGASRLFRTLVTEGRIIPSWEFPVSFTGWWKAGSDFSSVADGDSAAPLFHKPELSNRQFFPGPLEFDERVGSHVMGIGTELKLRLKKASNAIGLPSFALLQISAGTAMQDAADFSRLSALMTLNADIGFGVRINDGFGASIRLGVMRGIDNDYRPYSSLDLGSFHH